MPRLVAKGGDYAPASGTAKPRLLPLRGSTCRIGVCQNWAYSFTTASAGPDSVALTRTVTEGEAMSPVHRA